MKKMIFVIALVALTIVLFSVSEELNVSLDGGMKLITSDDNPGYWTSSEGTVFPEKNVLYFGTINKIGIEEFYFVPDTGKPCSCYFVVFVWKEFVVEIILLSLIILFLSKSPKTLSSNIFPKRGGGIAT